MYAKLYYDSVAALGFSGVRDLSITFYHFFFQSAHFHIYMACWRVLSLSLSLLVQTLTVQEKLDVQAETDLVPLVTREYSRA